MVAPTAQTSITVSWNTDSKVVAYKLEHALAGTPTPAWTVNENITPTPAAGPGATARTSYTVTTITMCATDYNFRVSGKGDGSASSYSADYGATATVTQSIPRRAPAPANVRPNPTSQTSITVSWDTDDKVTTYKLERAVAVTPTPAWTQVAVVTPAPSSTSTSYTDSTLSCGTNYLYRVSAIGDGTDYSKFEYGATSQPETASTDFYCIPQKLTVITLPHRKARITWSPVTGATAYAIQVMKQGGVWSLPTPVADTSKDIELDSILAGEGLADADAFHFRVQAVFPTPTPVSAFSKTITVIDSPIISINGNSPAGAKMVVKLEWAASRQYTLRYRQLPGDHRQLPRMGTPGWQPTPAKMASDWAVPTVTPSVTPNVAVKYEITLPATGNVYAVQAHYTDSSDTTTFAARERYVWPSSSAAGGGERVATFPLKYPLSLLSNKTYVYRICAGTFSSDANKQAAWRTFVIHALNQWHLATDGLVTMTHSPGGCADFSDHITLVYDGVKNRLMRKLEPSEDAKLRAQVRAHVGKIGSWLDIASQDRALNEISVIDLGADEYDALKAVEISAELAKDLGFATCIFKAPACAVRNRVPLTPLSTDILLNRSVYKEDPPAVPAVAFNTCTTGETKEYRHLVHEAGHSLGIREGGDGTKQLIHHPTIPDSVMSYEIELMLPDDPDCSPHPLDILAIYALYQSR